MTEKSGRIHTSAVSVAILPQADEVLAFIRFIFSDSVLEHCSMSDD